jgi:hypothetical protein
VTIDAAGSGARRPADRGAWEETLLDPQTQLVAERAARAAGLTLEAWLDRAIRRSCGNPTPATADVPAPVRRDPPAPPEPTPPRVEAAPASNAASDPPRRVRRWRPVAMLALPLLIAGAIAYVATRPAGTVGPAVVVDLPRGPAVEVTLAPAPATRAAPGNAEPADPAQLARWLEPRATSGDAVAQYRLGALYALGKGVAKDYARAAPLLRAAAESGLAEAQFDYGVLCENGLGVPRDAKIAAAWYDKAATQGNAEAALNLGYAYAQGAGVAKSLPAAARWFRRAAEQGVVNAQYNLGFLYERGAGVTRSALDAYLWYSLAGAQHDPGASEAAERISRELSPKQLLEAKSQAAALQKSIAGKR